MKAYRRPKTSRPYFVTHNTVSRTTFMSVLFLLPQVLWRRAEWPRWMLCMWEICIPELRETEYFIMGCKQTCLNFASEGNIVLIILDSKQICPCLEKRHYIFGGCCSLNKHSWKDSASACICRETQEIPGELSPDKRKAVSCLTHACKPSGEHLVGVQWESSSKWGTTPTY